MRDIMKSGTASSNTHRRGVGDSPSGSSVGGAREYLQSRAAGLTVVETEKLRDMKHNMAAEYNRKQRVIENERGGIYDRAEISGVKNMFIPTSHHNANDEM